MKRRTFLQCLLTTAGASVVGCKASDPAAATPSDASAADPGLGDPGAAVDLSAPVDTGTDAGTDSGVLPAPKDGAAWFPQSIASGDPRETSVVLWTRALDPKGSTSDQALRLEVSTTQDFATLVSLDGKSGLDLVAKAGDDHCVKVKVTGLKAATTYWYRFIVSVTVAGAAGPERYASHVARTRTAPAKDADVPVRFAMVACQDYIGRYYNAYTRLLEEELDFVVHLGDYIYETTGDKSFQTSTPERSITFSDKAGAIVFNAGTDAEYFAARSLSNYRELYRAYRGDATLQAVHERYPMIAIWDDHEFSDDAWRENGTYSDGVKDEKDAERRKAASRAWTEYMPVDFTAGPDWRYDPTKAVGDDIRIWRDFTFGKHVHLVLTDLRLHRADHVIPEDAYPGAVIATESALKASFGKVPDLARPYVEDIATYASGIYVAPLKAAAKAASYPSERVTGPINVAWLNTLVAAANAAAPPGTPPLPLIAEADEAKLPRGMAWIQAGKSRYFGNLGSRYLGDNDGFLLIAKVLWDMSGGESETCMGKEQEAWFLDTMKKSTSTWKLWGNEYCLLTHIVDLRAAKQLPASFQTRFNLLLDDWNGFPNRREQIVEALAPIGNVVALTGDIHSFWAGMFETASGKRLVELVTAGISSDALVRILIRYAKSDPVLAAAGATALAYGVESFLMSVESKANPTLGYVKTDAHGFAVVEASQGALDVAFHIIADTEVAKRLDAAALKKAFTVEKFRVPSGTAALQREDNGTYKVWDSTTQKWT